MSKCDRCLDGTAKFRVLGPVVDGERILDLAVCLRCAEDAVKQGMVVTELEKQKKDLTPQPRRQPEKEGKNGNNP